MAGIAINGLGRVGRAALKIIEDAGGAGVVAVNDVFREEAASDRYRAILGVAEDPVVSADIIGDSRATVVDVAMTRVVDGTLVKVMSWYDNEWGFTCQMIREAFAALASRHQISARSGRDG
jgi:glyceraldehyde 3-phosphate dehydrogenase